jgi:hypothetical protein
MRLPTRFLPASGRCPLIVLAAFLVLPPTAHAAGGDNINWGDGCYAETPIPNATFACDTNTGSHSVVVSFLPSEGMPDAVRIHAEVQIQTSSAYLPAWWQLVNSGGCREHALELSFDFSHAPQVACVNPFGAQVVGGTLRYVIDPSGIPNAAVVAVDGAWNEPIAFIANVEYYAFRLTFTNEKSIGADSCSGCRTRAAITLVGTILESAGGGREYLCDPVYNTCLSWQGFIPCKLACPGCGPCGLVPAGAITWGRVKALYR